MRVRQQLVKLISTFFYAGFFPLVPGTFASAIGVLIFYFLKDNLIASLSVTLFLVILGFLTCTEAEELFKEKDPKYIVIDEVSGMCLSLLFLPSYDYKVFILGFLVFRIFDTLKPFPIGRIQDLKGGSGVMSDDLLAALYTNITLQLSFRFITFKGS
ncbi:MAG: phosphatidylglycerophosphatase A [Candidatus Omnitrophota bacterium]